MNRVERPLKAGFMHNDPTFFVIHCMAEYVNDPGPVFAPDFLEKYGLSAHALIVPNGDVMICRDPNQGAYHARGYNKGSIGIEFLVNGQMSYGTFIERIKTNYVTDKQWKAGIEIVREWAEKYDIESMARHSDLSPGRKVDPGSGFNWDAFINATELQQL